MTYRGSITKKVMVEVEVVVDFTNEPVVGDGYHEPKEGGVTIQSVMWMDKNGKAVDVEHLLHEDDVSDIVELAHEQAAHDTYFGGDDYSDD